MSERLYLADKYGLPTGETIYRKERGNTKEHVLVVGALLIDEYGRLLIQQRSSDKKIAPNAWTLSTTGHVSVYDGGPIQNMIKEISEEIGVVVTKEDIAIIDAIEQHLSTDKKQVMYYYVGKINSDTKISINQDEVQDYQFISKEDLINLLDGEVLLGGIHKPIIDRFIAGEFD